MCHLEKSLQTPKAEQAFVKVEFLEHSPYQTELNIFYLLN